MLFFKCKTRFVFTIEASTHAYEHDKEKIVFTSQKYLEVGSKIAESLQEFVRILMKLPRRLEIKR